MGASERGKVAMTENLKMHYELLDAISGEKIKCIAEKITEVEIIGQSGRHRKQGLTVQNGTCWVTKTFRRSPIKL